MGQSPGSKETFGKIGQILNLKEKMKNITIQVDIPSDLLVALNESEKELNLISSDIEKLSQSY